MNSPLVLADVLVSSVLSLLPASIANAITNTINKNAIAVPIAKFFVLFLAANFNLSIKLSLFASFASLLGAFFLIRSLEILSSLLRLAKKSRFASPSSL